MLNQIYLLLLNTAAQIFSLIIFTSCMCFYMLNV